MQRVAQWQAASGARHGGSPKLPDRGSTDAGLARERREMPSHLVAEAAANPGGSVAEINGTIVTDPDGYVSAEAIIGCFLIRPDGLATGEYVRNPGYGPVRDDFTRLEQPDHWLGWLPDTPARSVRGELQDLLASQVEGSLLDWVKITDEPVFLTAGVRSPDDPRRLIVRRGPGRRLRARRTGATAQAGDPHRRVYVGHRRPRRARPAPGPDVGRLQYLTRAG